MLSCDCITGASILCSGSRTSCQLAGSILIDASPTCLGFSTGIFSTQSHLQIIAARQKFRVVVFDPPFFYIPMDELHRAVLEVCKGDTKTWLLIGFLVREERNLLNTFEEFKLMKTEFVLEYATVKPNKWRNYALYGNVDLPGIKRIQK
jgi:hypothetical protein